MPYQVMLVEDEAMILKYNKRIIERVSDQFRVCFMAENGREALEYLRDHPVDVVFMDVKMPIMDGIELAQEISKNYPRIVTVVVSGYQDFYYVRECLRRGCEDYLLKPLKEDITREKLGSIEEKLDRQGHEEFRLAVLENIKSGAVGESLQKWMRQSSADYQLLVIAAGCQSIGHAAHLRHGDGEDAQKVFDSIQAEAYIELPGRFDNERIYLVKKTRFEYMLRIFDALRENQGNGIFYTGIYAEAENRAENSPHGLYDPVHALFTELDEVRTIGRHTFYKYRAHPQKTYTGLDVKQRGKLSSILKTSQVDDLKDFLIALFERWEQEQAPLLWVDSVIMEILSIASSVHPAEQQTFLQASIMQMEEIYAYAKSMSDVLFGLCDYLSDAFGGGRNERSGTYELFLSVRNYVYAHIGENIHIKDITEQLFISQTYVNRLFRKYEKTSFYDFVLDVKIEEAKSILERSTNIQTKHVASMLGFSDPSYFSKVFKKRVKSPPSEYVKKWQDHQQE